MPAPITTACLPRTFDIVCSRGQPKNSPSRSPKPQTLCLPCFRRFSPIAEIGFKCNKSRRADPRHLGSITMVDRPCAMPPPDRPRSCGIMPVQRCEFDHEAPRPVSWASRATSWSCRPPPRSSPDRAMARQARAACHGRGRVLCPHHDRSWRIDAWPLGAATGGVAHAARALMHGQRSPLARQSAARGAGSLRRRRAGCGAASARRRAHTFRCLSAPDARMAVRPARSAAFR